MLKPRSGSRCAPLRVAVPPSRRAPGLSHLLEHDPNRGRLYQLGVGVATEPASETVAQLESAGVSCEIQDLRAFCSVRGGKLGDLGLRRIFDGRTARFLQAYRPELVLLAGYLHILTEPMLVAHPQAIINIHDADLAITDADGKPRHRGLRSTYDALASGQPETRSTVHLVTPEVDVGPPLIRSGAFPVPSMIADARRRGATEILKTYAHDQREWMMRGAGGAGGDGWARRGGTGNALPPAARRVPDMPHIRTAVEGAAPRPIFEGL